MNEAEIRKVLHAMGVLAGRETGISQYHAEEDGKPYNVYGIHSASGHYVLKLAKGDEVAVYSSFLSHSPKYAPKLYARHEDRQGTWILMEEIQGKPLTHCTRDALRLALDSLILMQREFWDADAGKRGLSYAACLEQRRKRRDYLEDSVLEAVYDWFLTMFQSTPKTLCHDDLLPFNVLVDDRRAVMIDWEAADIMAYPTSFARLIAHGTQQPDNLFHLEAEDRAFAIDYYYQNLLQPLGIPFSEYQKALDLALFYEYCEWIYVGNRYNDRNSTYYRKYNVLARDFAQMLLQKYHP